MNKKLLIIILMIIYAAPVYSFAANKANTYSIKKRLTRPEVNPDQLNISYQDENKLTEPQFPAYTLLALSNKKTYNVPPYQNVSGLPFIGKWMIAHSTYQAASKFVPAHWLNRYGSYSPPLAAFRL